MSSKGAVRYIRFADVPVGAVFYRQEGDGPFIKRDESTFKRLGSSKLFRIELEDDDLVTIGAAESFDENPLSPPAKTALIVGGTVAALGTIAYFFFRPKSSETYRGYTFQTAYFSDYYNGTGWRFRFVNTSPDGVPMHTDKWMGVFSSKNEAAASARYIVDQYAV